MDTGDRIKTLAVELTRIRGVVGTSGENDVVKKVYEKLNIEELKSILKADSELSDYEKTIIRLIIQKNSGVINPYF